MTMIKLAITVCAYSKWNCTMSKAKAIPPSAPTTFDLLGFRIQAAINSPRAQKAQAALLERMPSDRQADWDRLLEEISENDNVTVSIREGGHVQVAWTLPPQD
ncbi:DUF1654 domain-containing protein [Pseudomonas shirazica]|uniref:DUF1654 domain-containing protein n=1 Tax=Pseudomonas shirazica TaxID=1940636 RepID=UPI002ED27E78